MVGLLRRPFLPGVIWLIRRSCTVQQARAASLCTVLKGGVHLNNYHHLQELRGIENGTCCKSEISSKLAVFILLYKDVCPNHSAKQMRN